MIDWDDAFDNSGYVAGVEELAAQWVSDAAAYRSARVARETAHLDISYGSDAREAFDLFLPDDRPKGTVVFVHGGYWHKLDKSYWSHFANGCVSNGWAVAIPSYPLAPQVSVSQITESISRMVQHVAEITDGAIALTGHSAGGHLVSRMICTGVLPKVVVARITRVVPVSGVYHLNPLLKTTMNDTLRLTESEVMTESPVHLDPVTGIPVTFWVGDHERPEFLRQTRMIAEHWAAKGVQAHSVYEPGFHHFNVIASLQDMHGTLTREITQV